MRPIGGVLQPKKTISSKKTESNDTTKEINSSYAGGSQTHRSSFGGNQSSMNVGKDISKF